MVKKRKEDIDWDDIKVEIIGDETPELKKLAKLIRLKKILTKILINKIKEDFDEDPDKEANWN